MNLTITEVLKCEKVGNLEFMKYSILYSLDNFLKINYDSG